jgi:uncharacterized protein (TIGR00369 family)
VESFLRRLPNFSVSHLRVWGAVALLSNLRLTDDTQIQWGPFGGVLCDIADAAMGIAYSTTLAPEETFTTIELHINFLRPVWNAKLRAEARMVRAGKLVGLVECDIFDELRRLVARASSTCMTLAGTLGEGRSLPVDLPRYLKENPQFSRPESSQYGAVTRHSD